MQINIISEAVLDTTSDPSNPRWYAVLKIKTLKKGFEEIEVWKADISSESIEEAEDVGYERLAIGLIPLLK